MVETEKQADPSAPSDERFVNRRVRVLMSMEGGFFLLVGLLLLVGRESASQRVLATIIAMMGLIGLVRSAIAYEVRVSASDVVLKSFYQTRRISLVEICEAKAVLGSVLLYQRCYLQIVERGGKVVHFKALNQNPSKHDVISASADSINRRLPLDEQD